MRKTKEIILQENGEKLIFILCMPWVDTGGNS